jgi:hypothetical protein
LSMATRLRPGRIGRTERISRSRMVSGCFWAARIRMSCRGSRAHFFPANKCREESRHGRHECPRHSRFSIWSAPIQLGFAVWTAAAPITGAPAAYCFDIHALRASRTERLSAPEHHRYVRFLDWKVSCESGKTVDGRFDFACKCWQTGRFKLFSRVVNGFLRCGRVRDVRGVRGRR